jgi:hypothetical protein
MNLTPLIREERDKLDKLLKLLRSLDPLTESSQFSAISQYLCVRIAGYVEVGVDSLFEAYIDQHSRDPRLRSVALRYVGQVQSANYDKIRELLKAFDTQWADDFSRKVADKTRDNLRSLFEQRNRVAHGRSVDLDRPRLKEYLDAANSTLETLARILN